MACYLEAADLGVWRLTHEEMKPPKNPEKLTTSDEKEIHLNARAKNCLYESLSMEIFNQVFTLKQHCEEDYLPTTTTKIWEHHHHSSQYGGLESNDPDHCDWENCSI